MFPFGAIAGVLGAGISGVASIINNKRMQAAADRDAALQQAYYTGKANENTLSRSEVQHMLGAYDRAAQQQLENARGVAAITGSTPEFASSVQKGIAEGRANMMSDITAGASERADHYNQLAESARHQKELDDQERRMARNQTYANLAANSASAVGAIMDAYSPSIPQHENIAKLEAPKVKGLEVQAPPTTVQNEMGKMNDNLAKIKQSLAVAI